MATRPRRRRRSKFATVNRGSVRKHSIYFPAHILAEIGAEAVRLDRSLSWMVQHAWKRARAEIAGDRSTPGQSQGFPTKVVTLCPPSVRAGAAVTGPRPTSD
jgi:uncharacterized small protein (TIGR04563 family)